MSKQQPTPNATVELTNVDRALLTVALEEWAETVADVHEDHSCGFVQDAADDLSQRINSAFGK